MTFKGSSAENSGDSQSDDIPVLSEFCTDVSTALLIKAGNITHLLCIFGADESKMNVPDMKGVVLKNPEPVAGRRTALPARQPNPPTFGLLALLRR